MKQYVDVPIRIAGSHQLFLMGICVGWCNYGEKDCDCQKPTGCDGTVTVDYYVFLTHFLSQITQEGKFDINTKYQDIDKTLMINLGKRYHYRFKQFRKIQKRLHDDS